MDNSTHALFEVTDTSWRKSWWQWSLETCSMVFDKRDWRKHILYLKGVKMLLTFPLSSLENSNMLHCFLFAAYDSRLLILLPYLTSSRAHAIDFWTVKDSLFLSFQLSLCMCPFFKSFDFDFICCSQDARTVVPFMWKPQINHLYSLIGILSFFMAPNSFEEWSIGFRFLYLHQHKKAFCCI